MFKAKTLEDFPELRKAIEKVNMEDIFRLRLEIRHDYSECDLYVIDSAEEFYYGDYDDYVMKILEEALEKDTGDSDAYFDCECPGRWIADFEGRSRYTARDIEDDISTVIYNAMCKYADSNALKCNWEEKVKKEIDAFPAMIARAILNYFY